MVCKQDRSVTQLRLEMPTQLRGMQTGARAGLEPKHPRRAFQLQAMPHIVKEKENSSEEHLQL